MTDPLDNLLESLGKVFGMNLHRDKAGGCALQIRKGIVIELQTNESMEKLLIATRIVEVPPGKFREEVLLHALKSNGQKEQQVGTFAFLEKNNILFLFQYYPISILNGERLASMLGPFIGLAEKYRNAVLSGRLP